MGIGKGVWVGWMWMVDDCWRHVSRIFAMFLWFPCSFFSSLTFRGSILYAWCGVCPQPRALNHFI